MRIGTWSLGGWQRDFDALRGRFSLPDFSLVSGEFGGDRFKIALNRVVAKVVQFSRSQ